MKSTHTEATSKLQKVILFMLFLILACTLFTIFGASPYMKSERLILTTAFDLFGMVIAIILYLSCCQDVSADDPENLYFRFLILIVFVAMVTDFYGSRLDGIPELRKLCYFFDFASYIENILRSYVCWLFFNSVLRTSERDKNILKKIFYPCLFFQIGLFIVNLFYPIIFTINENGNFIYASTEWLCYPYYIITAAISFYMLYKSKRSSRVRISIAIYITFPLIIDIFNVRFLDLSCLIFVASLLSILYMYSNIYVQRGHDLDKQKTELAISQLNSMIMQINPHFIYNTLGSISSLCSIDAEIAAEMTNTFARYLRGNMDAVMDNGINSFEKELEQVKLYLRIEQVRFPGIDVYYHIGPRDFKLPCLSIQPLAENAIRHGIRQKLGSRGIVEISTSEDENAYYVVVKDNGAGFDVAHMTPNDDKTHIGIANVSKRLELLMGGSLQIESTKGVGTSCKITIPKEKAKL